LTRNVSFLAGWHALGSRKVKKYETIYNRWVDGTGMDKNLKIYPSMQDSDSSDSDDSFGS